jgi:flagellar FliL protein
MDNVTSMPPRRRPPALALLLCLALLAAAAAPALASGGGGSSGPPSTVLAMEPFMINLADEGGKRYLKVTISVDLREEPRKKALEERLPIARDSILLLLSSKTVKDVSTLEGKLTLRDEIRRLVARTIGAPERQPVVYFTDFFIQ